MSRENFLDINNCKIVRAIMAIMIMLHHISQYVYCSSIFNFIFEQIGSTATAIFFFYSGYGVMQGLINKNDYMNGFLKKRFVSVGVPFIIANLIYYVLLTVDGLFTDRMSYLFTRKFEKAIIPNAWFVIMIMLMYIAFYISLKFTQTRKTGIAVCSGIIFLYAIILCTVQLRPYWYSALFAFVFGLIHAEYKSKFDSLLQKHAVLKFIFFCFAFLFLTVIAKVISSSYIVLIIKNIRAVITCTIVLWLSMIIGKRNSVLEHFGDISYEIFLYHGIIMEFLYMRVGNITVFILLIFILTFIIAETLHKGHIFLTLTR
ncbi:Membrane-bound acyltransferase YfiQ, involved in biofilm formation [Lachnospiraceae bacterium]|nr:Membrane-bound acyltransferase YfiQ, involved in biofilm formation [Lachnospiraceae bacterium]